MSTIQPAWPTVGALQMAAFSTILVWVKFSPPSGSRRLGGRAMHLPSASPLSLSHSLWLRTGPNTKAWKPFLIPNIYCVVALHQVSKLGLQRGARPSCTPQETPPQELRLILCPSRLGRSALVLLPGCLRPAGLTIGAPENSWLIGARVSQRGSINEQTLHSELAWES